MLTACGGGGGGDSTTTTSSPTPAPSSTPAPAPAVLQPQTTVPNPTYTDQHKLDAFNRVNAIRSDVGLGLLAQNSALDSAAQAHSDWLAINLSSGHVETAGTPAFYAATLGERLTKAAYSYSGGMEIIDYTPNVAGSVNADNLASMVYHRVPFFMWHTAEIGIGYASYTTSGFPNKPIAMTIEISQSTSRQQGSPSVPYVVWPKAGSMINRLDMRPENPNPVATQDSGAQPYGYPVSVHVDENGSIAATSFELRDSNGNLVPAYVLTYATDPNMVSLRIKNSAVLAPKAPLVARTTYTASFAGTKTLNGVTSPLTVSWSFTTP